MKICLVASPGGHLTELSYLKTAYDKYDFFLISNDWPRVRNLPVRKYLVPLFTRNVFNIFPAMLITLKAFIYEKPDVVITTGAEVALPVFFWAKIFRVKTVFIETISRFETRTLSGALLYPFSDKFYVQNIETLKLYGDKAEFHGAIL